MQFQTRCNPPNARRIIEATIKQKPMSAQPKRWHRPVQRRLLILLCAFLILLVAPQ